MSAFAELMQANPPRLVVQCSSERGEQFQWGITGSMPVLNLFGRILGPDGQPMRG